MHLVDALCESKVALSTFEWVWVHVFEIWHYSRRDFPQCTRLWAQGRVVRAEVCAMCGGVVRAARHAKLARELRKGNGLGVSKPAQAVGRVVMGSNRRFMPHTRATCHPPGGCARCAHRSRGGRPSSRPRRSASRSRRRRRRCARRALRVCTWVGGRTGERERAHTGTMGWFEDAFFFAPIGKVLRWEATAILCSTTDCHGGARGG